MLRKLGITAGILLGLWIFSVMIPLGIGAGFGFKSAYHETKSNYFQSSKFAKCTELTDNQRKALAKKQWRKQDYWRNISDSTFEFGFNNMGLPLIIAEKLIKYSTHLNYGRNC